MAELGVGEHSVQQREGQELDQSGVLPLWLCVFNLEMAHCFLQQSRRQLGGSEVEQQLSERA